MVDSRQCDQGITKNTPVSITCFYTLLLEVSHHGSGASPRPLLPPFASASLCKTSHSHGVKRQRQGTRLFYYSWAPHTLAEGLRAARAQLNKPNPSTAETWFLLVPPLRCRSPGTTPPAPHAPLVLVGDHVSTGRSEVPGAGALTEGSHWGGTDAGGAGAGAGAMGSLHEP